MKKLLQALGVLALVLWTVLGMAAWLMTKDQVHVVLSPDEPGAEADPVALLAEQVGALERDLAALNETLASNFSILDQRVSKAVAEGDGGDRAALERERRARLDALEARLQSGTGNGAAPAAAPAEPPAAEPAAGAGSPAPDAGASPSTSAAPAPASGASFLAFELPSQSF